MISPIAKPIQRSTVPPREHVARPPSRPRQAICGSHTPRVQNVSPIAILFKRENLGFREGSEAVSRSGRGGNGEGAVGRRSVGNRPLSPRGIRYFTGRGG
jgi:hypothetical protein